MPSHDETVSKDRIQRVYVMTRMRGWQGTFRLLKHQEPVLAAYALSVADKLARKLEECGTATGLVQMIHREVIIAEMVCIQSMRQASRELWKDFLPGAELGRSS